MAQYDVYPTADGYLPDLQTDLLDGLNTHVVAPLLREAIAPKPARTFNPVFEIGGELHVMAAQFLSVIPAMVLKTPVANLAGHADAITRAKDMLFHGF
jgi:toxin CcdB